MQPHDLEALREVLRAPGDRWSGALDQYAEHRNPETMAETWLFLHGRLPDAGEPHRERMTAMLARIEAWLGRTPADPATLERLADDLDQLRRQASEIDRSLTARRQLLAAMLGPDRRTRVGPFAIRTSAPAFSVKILDEQAVPAPFLSSSPDRKAILKHFQDTGEIPPGVDVNPRRTVVNVTRKG